MEEYQKFIHASKYARWREEDKRRETFQETVDRYCDFMLEHVEKNTSISPESLALLKEIMG